MGGVGGDGGVSKEIRLSVFAVSSLGSDLGISSDWNRAVMHQSFETAPPTAQWVVGT